MFNESIYHEFLDWLTKHIYFTILSCTESWLDLKMWLFLFKTRAQKTPVPIKVSYESSLPQEKINCILSLYPYLVSVWTIHFPVLVYVVYYLTCSWSSGYGRACSIQRVVGVQSPTSAACLSVFGQNIEPYHCPCSQMVFEWNIIDLNIV